MRRMVLVCGLGMAALLAACGSDTEQKAASGGLGGAAAGAAVGGPVGAVVGAGVGAAGGAGMEYAEEKGMIDTGQQPTHQAQAATPEREDVRRAQTALKAEGLYKGPIDGIEGPQTRQAAAAFQQRNNMQQSARLDQPTMDALTGAMAALPPERIPAR